jgi:hypothetical protein
VRPRIRELIGVAVVLVGVLLAGTTYAQLPNLVLSGFTSPPWPENEVGYTETPEVTRYWDGADFAESWCEDCVAVFFPITSGPLQTDLGSRATTLYVQRWEHSS